MISLSQSLCINPPILDDHLHSLDRLPWLKYRIDPCFHLFLSRVSNDYQINHYPYPLIPIGSVDIFFRDAPSMMCSVCLLIISRSNMDVISRCSKNTHLIDHGGYLMIEHTNPTKLHFYQVFLGCHKD